MSGSGADFNKPINIWRTNAKNPNAENAVWTHTVVLPPPAGHSEMKVCNDNGKWTCNGVGETSVACSTITSVGATSSTSSSSSSSSSSSLEDDLSAISTALKSGGSIALNFD